MVGRCWPRWPEEVVADGVKGVSVVSEERKASDRPRYVMEQAAVLRRRQMAVIVAPPRQRAVTSRGQRPRNSA